MYAIIKATGNQYKVSKGDKVVMQKVEGEPGTEIVFDEVLLAGDENSTKIGEPTIKGASVTAKISKQFKDDKIIVFKKKRRHNYRRKKGHRQQLTEVEISEIKIA